MSISANAQGQKKKAPDVLIKEAFNIPIEQVSGLGIREGLKIGDFEVFAIGDQSSEVRILSWKQQKRSELQRKFDFSAAVNNRFSPCLDLKNKWCKNLSNNLNSDWEAIQVDSKQRRFILHENSGVVMVLDESNRHLTDIRLDYRPIYQSYEARTNLKAKRKALGEGLVLMKNGHILLAYQFDPAQIIEFGPAGAKANGLGKGGFLSRVEAFQLDDKKQKQIFEPLRFWSLQGLDGCDLNELTYDTRNDRVLVISKRCNSVYSIVDSGGKQKEGMVTVEYKWKLPKKIKAIEGLAVLPNGQWLIASDLPERGAENVFLLSPLIKSKP
jgi:hypothetical protein